MVRIMPHLIASNTIMNIKSLTSSGIEYWLCILSKSLKYKYNTWDENTKGIRIKKCLYAFLFLIASPTDIAVITNVRIVKAKYPI